MKTYPTLHVYGQTMGHDDCSIVGTRPALEALAVQIQKALATEKVTEHVHYVNDGEGYRVMVLCASDSEMESLMDPYQEGLGPNEGTAPYILFRGKK